MEVISTMKCSGSMGGIFLLKASSVEIPRETVESHQMNSIPTKTKQRFLETAA
jgi:hypothetical protein